MSTENALVLIDYINELVPPEGTLAGKGYADFISSHDTSVKVAEFLAIARQDGCIVCHVRVGFDAGMLTIRKTPRFFGATKKFAAQNHDSWGCEFIDFVSPKDDEAIAQKRHVSAF